MKLQSASATLRGIFGGNALEVLSKIAIAAVAAMWANLQVIGLSVLAYFLLLMVDAGMGAALAHRRDEGFSFTHFTFGPLKKFVLTTGMFLCTAIVDGMLPKAAWIPDSPLFYGVALFICTSQLFDVAKKYGTLSGSNVANWIEDKLGSFVKTGPKVQN